MKLIKPPRSYEELRSELRGTDEGAPAPKNPTRATRTDIAKPLDAPRNPDSAPAAPVLEQASEKSSTPVKCSFRIPLPASPSPSREYTALVEHYGEPAAIKLLLRAAVEEWIAQYTPETPIAQKPLYAKSRETFATTRHLDAQVIEKVRRRIDPMNRRPNSYIARMIALSALAAYLERH